MKEWMSQIAELTNEGRIREAINMAMEVAKRTGEYDAVAFFLICIGAEIGNMGNMFAVTPLFEAAEVVARSGEVKRLARKNLAIAHINCGMAFFDNRRYDLAEKHYIKALLLDPTNPDFHYHYGLLLHISKRYLEAEKHYKEAIRADPKHIKALNNCALVLQELNRYEEAEKFYKEVLRQNPKLAEAHFNYGFLLYNDSRYWEAEEQYKLALKINPNLAQAHNNYALLLEKLRRFEEAEKHYKEAIRLDRGNSNIRLNYALLLHHKLKRYDEAEKFYEETLRVNPREIVAHFNYGNLLIALKRYDDAEAHYQEVYRISNENGDLAISAMIASSLGFLLMLSFRLSEAKSWFERARQEFTVSGEWRHGSTCMLAWKRVVEAFESWKKGRWKECNSALRQAEDAFYNADERENQFWVSITMRMFNIDRKLARMAEALRRGEYKSYMDDFRIVSREIFNLLAQKIDQAWGQLMHAKLRCSKLLMYSVCALISTVLGANVEGLFCRAEFLRTELKRLQDSTDTFYEHSNLSLIHI